MEHCEGHFSFQEIARNKGVGEEDTVGLDIHAIDELQKKGCPTTNEKPKYDYKADEDGNYGILFHFIYCSSFFTPY